MDQLIPAPPPGLNYIAVIHLSLNFILIVAPLGAVFVPLIITLFFFSTPQIRRQPLFILNILACFCGLCQACLTVGQEVQLILNPLHPIPKALYLSIFAFGVVSVMFIESILLFRIFAFYPLSLTPKSQLVAIFMVPILAKSGRLIASIMLFYQFRHQIAPVSDWPKIPSFMSGWYLQLIDMIYTTVFLLCKVILLRRKRSDLLVIRSKSLLDYLKSLFILALGNFVFPIVMNISATILITTDPDSLNGFYLIEVSNYISIIGVVFATVWTRRLHWNNRNPVGSADIELRENRRTTTGSTLGRPDIIIPTREVLHFGVASSEGSNDSKKEDQHPMKVW
ncbi:hypothetical protein BYT27DRAFT_7202443 [Phlegmacium glaucopus]|nr:hypothetical protein BYT27DRAFT_7202443 [Phlegmacium glaucopus]